MSFWRKLLQATLIENPISTFAVLCVACTAGFLGYMTYWQTEILSSADWCSKALQAERVSAERGGGMTSCHDILMVQLKALATNSHVDHGVFGMVLLVLIVVVIAGARLSLAASKSGVSANIGREEVEAAQHVADKAEEGVAEVKEAVASSGPPAETLPDYAR